MSPIYRLNHGGRDLFYKIEPRLTSICVDSIRHSFQLEPLRQLGYVERASRIAQFACLYFKSFFSQTDTSLQRTWLLYTAYKGQDQNIRLISASIVAPRPAQQEQPAIPASLTRLFTAFQSKGKTEWYDQMIKHDPALLSNKTFIDLLLQDATAPQYFFEYAEGFLRQLVATKGNPEELSLAFQQRLLPLFPPAKIYEILKRTASIDFINFEQDAKRYTIPFDGVRDSLFNLLQNVYTTHCLYIDNENQGNYHCQKTQQFLSQIPFHFLARAIRQPILMHIMFGYAKVMNQAQLAVIIPFLLPTQFSASIESIRPDFSLLAKLLGAATKEQKKSVFGHLMTMGPLLPANIPVLKAALLKHDDSDTAFTQEVENVISTLVTHPSSSMIVNALDLPEEYVCPLSADFMKDPVIVFSSNDGGASMFTHTYDRESIERALKAKSGINPLNNLPITKIEPATQLKAEIDQWKKNNRGI